jgi:hypothetical protein
MGMGLIGILDIDIDIEMVGLIGILDIDIEMVWVWV